MMNPNDFGDSLTFSLAPQLAHICCFECNVSATIGWIDIKFGTDDNAPLKMNYKNFSDLLTCHLTATSCESNFGLWPDTSKTNDIPISLNFVGYQMSAC